MYETNLGGDVKYKRISFIIHVNFKTTPFGMKIGT